MAYTLNTLTTYVRNLTGIQSVDLVTDALIKSWLNEAYHDVARIYNWSWTPVTDMGDSDSPAFAAEYHHLLAYRVAAKLLQAQGDDSNRAEVYLAEFKSVVDQMYLKTLQGTAAGSYGNRGQLRALARSLAGEFSDKVSDTLINMWLDEEYIQLSNLHDWKWREQVGQYTIGTATPTANVGTPRVLEVFYVRLADSGDIVTDAVNDSEIISIVPHSLDTQTNDVYYKYTVSPAGVLRITPTPEQDITIRVRYMGSVSGFANDSSAVAFATRFAPILAYRVATRIASHAGGNPDAVAMFASSADQLYMGMLSEYQLSHNMEPIQMGGVGLESPRYLPWFRGE